jgi:hypothetical protein
MPTVATGAVEIGKKYQILTFPFGYNISPTLAISQKRFETGGHPDAVGVLNDYESFRDRYEAAFVAIGDNRLRSHWQEKLKLAGYQIPTLIHPRAYISPSSIIGSGYIIFISAVIEHDSRIDSFAHVDCGVILPPRTHVGKYRKLEIINPCQSYGINADIDSDRELADGETSTASILSEKQRCENPN